jgi:hypothetical protein
MRHALAPAREEREEGEWIIAAAETVINPIFAGTKLFNITAKKAGETPCSKTEPLKGSEILSIRRNDE